MALVVHFPSQNVTFFVRVKSGISRKNWNT